jgi:DNA-binding response OmpR family regulator
MTPVNKIYKVLIVEDEPEILSLVKDTLAADKYEFLEALDGEQGLALARRSAPDLVLLDILMPKLNGYEVCRQLKADDQTRQIPILMMTAYGQKKEIEEGFRVKADGYIVKPFEPEKLREQVQRQLQHAQIH